MNDDIRTVEQLEAQVGATPNAINLKVINHLDAHALRWLEASPLAFAGFSDTRQIDVTLAGGAPGFASSPNPTQLHLPAALLDDAQHAQPGRGAGLLFLVPGLGETLRVNGTVTDIRNGTIVVSVQECYAHCAKALLRSAFWQPATALVPDGTTAFLRACRFMTLATANTYLHTDLSPKGDPAGALVHAFGRGIRFAERPGNRRTDSLRNLLARPQAAALLLVPGCTQVALIAGDAEMTADLQLRQNFAVQGKVPKLVTSVISPLITLRESAALAGARLWPVSGRPAGLDPAAMFAAHVRLNKSGGLHAALARKAVSIPGLMRKGLEHDYKHNLY